MQSKAATTSVNPQKNNKLIAIPKRKTLLTLMLIFSQIQPGNSSSEIEKQKEKYNSRSIALPLQGYKERELGESFCSAKFAEQIGRGANEARSSNKRMHRANEQMYDTWPGCRRGS
ncbi:hypothetical protein [Candidatus Cardinium hertigii]|nr:hypothetical protein [Candidatus Cardinium hertigii]